MSTAVPEKTRGDAMFDVAAHDRAFGTVAVAASLLAIGLAAIYWAARTGFANPLSPVAMAAALALFIIDTPYVARMITRRVADSYTWATSYSFYWLLSLVIAVLAGRLAAAIAIDLLPVLAVVGVSAFLVTLVDWIRGASLWRSAVVVAGSLGFATFAGGVVWGRIYKSPLFIEMLQVNGVVHHDPVSLAAMANMLRTYHVPTVGLDGLPYMSYHWGSPWVFGHLSDLLRSPVLEFYNLGYVITMLPLFFGSILCFAVESSAMTVDLRRRLRPLGVFLVATVGVFPITGMDAMGVWTSNLMISESYAIGLGVALLLAGTAVAWARGPRILVNVDTDITSRRLAAGDWIFAAVVLPVGLVALGYLKISMMGLGFIAAMYGALRLGLLRRPAFLALGAALTLMVGYTATLTSLPEHREGFVPLDFLKGFVPPEWWPYFLLVQLFWSLLYVVIRLRSEGVRTVADLRTAVRANRVLDAELVAIIAVVGVLPGFITHIDGGSAFYFADIQRWLSVALLMGLVAITSRDSLRRRRADGGSRRPLSLRTVAIAFLAAPLLYSMAANSVYWTRRMLAANAGLRRDAYPPEVAANIPPGIRGLPHLTSSAYLQQGLEASENYLPVLELSSLAQLPRAERSRTALFIPQSEPAYWGILKRPGACSFSGHVAPAIASMAMVDGMPPFGCDLSRYYGLGLFQKRSREQIAADTLPATLCNRVARYGLTRVMTLHFDQTGRATKRVDECRIAR